MSKNWKDNFNLIFPFFLVTLVAALIAISLEVFWRRRDRLVQNISSMVGEHLSNIRTSDRVGGPMPVHILESGMNQVIDEHNDEEAKRAMETMMAVVVESKRRSFLLPLVHKDVFQRVKAWAEKGHTAKSSEIATKLIVHIAERHAQHMDQIVAQSYAVVSDSDPRAAALTMRSLSHQVDGALAAGIKIHPSLFLLSPNDATVKKWAEQNDHAVAKAAAQLLHKTAREADITFQP
jgi:hypothetical protein